MARRRPADRRSQIQAAAQTLFLRRGYHNVCVADVAGAVGITAAALYHHFRDKQELLFHALLGGLADVEAAIGAAVSLEDALRSLVRLIACQRRPLAVWEREARYLQDPRRREIICARAAQVAAGLTRLLRTARPELGAADARVLAWAVLGVLVGGAGRPPGLCRPADEQLMFRLGFLAAHAGLPGPARTGTQALAAVRHGAPKAGARAETGPRRRSQLLAEAVVLFGERGFQSVTMADIGAAAGIVASGVYRHFPGKADLLAAAAELGAESMRADADLALAGGGDPRAALELLLRGYIALTIEHRQLIAILAHERAQLPADARIALRRSQADYLGIWVNEVGAVAPGREPAALQLAVEAVHAMIYLVVRSCQVRQRPDLPGRLTEIGMTVLLG